MLRERIQTETVAAMKAGQKERLHALRLINAKIKDRDIEQRTSAKPIEGDPLVIDVLQKMAKQRRESIEMYQAGGRAELEAQERQELAVIEEFLPTQMGEAEMKAAIEAIKAELGATGLKDMGRVMAELKARHGTELDMSQASGLAKAALA